MKIKKYSIPRDSNSQQAELDFLRLHVKKLKGTIGILEEEVRRLHGDFVELQERENAALAKHFHRKRRLFCSVAVFGFGFLWMIGCWYGITQSLLEDRRSSNSSDPSILSKNDTDFRRTIDFLHNGHILLMYSTVFSFYTALMAYGMKVSKKSPIAEWERRGAGLIQWHLLLVISLHALFALFEILPQHYFTFVLPVSIVTSFLSLLFKYLLFFTEILDTHTHKGFCNALALFKSKFSPLFHRIFSRIVIFFATLFFCLMALASNYPNARLLVSCGIINIATIYHTCILCTSRGTNEEVWKRFGIPHVKLHFVLIVLLHFGYAAAKGLPPNYFHRILPGTILFLEISAIFQYYIFHIDFYSNKDKANKLLCQAANFFLFPLKFWRKSSVKMHSCEEGIVQIQEKC